MSEFTARDVCAGDHIMWAGRKCTVLRAERLLRERYQHRIWMSFDLDVPGLPPWTGVRYEVNEVIPTW